MRRFSALVVMVVLAGCRVSVEVNSGGNGKGDLVIPPPPPPPDERAPAPLPPEVTLRGATLKNGNQIDIPGTILFKSGSAKIVMNDDSKKVLDAVLVILKKNPEITTLSVEGNTDNAGDAQGYDNVSLSQRRSEAVVAWLVKNGIEQNRLEPMGHGSSHPLVENDSKDHMRQNRRVEFHVLGFSGQSTTPSSSYDLGAPNKASTVKK